MPIRVNIDLNGILTITHTYREGTVVVREFLTLTDKEFKDLYKKLQGLGFVAQGP